MTDSINKISHTPGPWLISSNTIICTSLAQIVAQCQPTGIAALDLPPDQIRANTRLMSAAPELLEELQRARRVLVAEGYIPAASMDAAIAKATGEQA